MNKSEAYERLGYSLRNTRWSWSATNPTGVCIDLWWPETQFSGNAAWFDTRLHGGAIEEWSPKIGNKDRIEHLARAVSEFDRYVDVVIIDGDPGKTLRDSTPWYSSAHDGRRWRITFMDIVSGHFAVETQPG